MNKPGVSGQWFHVMSLECHYIEMTRGNAHWSGAWVSRKWVAPVFQLPNIWVFIRVSVC